MSRPQLGWRTVAWAGVVLGVVAAFAAIPPVTIRTPVVPVVIGLIAVTIGVGSLFRGERRVGGYAVVVGVLGLVIGYLATRSSIGNLESVVVWGALLSSMLRFATPLMFAALGGLFSERSGVVNIGLEGMMLMGAFFAVWGADVTGNWATGLVIGIVAGGLTALVHAFFSISLRADQIVSGTAINFLALGITSYLFIKLYREQGTPGDLSSIPDLKFDFLRDIPGAGSFLYDWFGDLDLLIWLALVSVVLTWVVVFRTPIGLRIRSVGEHPRAADTVGINVYAIRYGAVTLSGMLAAAGGAY
ncbi:MAG: ABC transporter permease, partial [Thermoleophilia bacterium]|nr:ABC transporter permease [Thermoleophilia bacterium]